MADQYQSPEQVLAQLGQQLEAETKQLYLDGAAITENGRERHGTENFNRAINDLTAKTRA
jgi:hypothetical protein